MVCDRSCDLMTTTHNYCWRFLFFFYSSSHIEDWLSIVVVHRNRPSRHGLGLWDCQYDVVWRTSHTDSFENSIRSIDCEIQSGWHFKSTFRFRLVHTGLLERIYANGKFLISYWRLNKNPIWWWWCGGMRGWNNRRLGS